MEDVKEVLAGTTPLQPVRACTWRLTSTTRAGTIYQYIDISQYWQSQ